MMKRYEKRYKRYEGKAFTLVEVLVGTAVFIVVALATYNAFTALFQLASGAQARTLAVALADEQFEIIRNMPYTSVGLTNGIPLGILPQLQTISRGGMSFTVNLTVRNVNLSTTTLQASDKLVEIDVECPTCKDYQPVILTGQISPANLQSAGNGGALVVQVFDANGLPVEDAVVDVQSVATSSVKNNDVTNNNGLLNIIGVPPGTNMYNIIVSKTGYSSDRTYASGGAAGASPDKPNANVLNQQVTTVSFSIDRLSSLHFSSVTPLCTPVPSVHFSLTGSKKLATTPSVILKYPTNNIVTDGSGVYDLNSMEWDTYTLTPTDSSFDVAGINPFSPFVLNPNNSQNVQLVVVPKNGNSLMVSVMDSATKLPISGATVHLTGPSSFDDTQITGQGYISQTDWSGGDGQTMYSNTTKYASSNGLVDTSTTTGSIKLLWQPFTEYSMATGTLESSTFDTGTTSNFYTFSWKPTGQPMLAGVTPAKFQFATSPTSNPGSWNYLGPDGTSNTYFTVPGASISSANNGNQFARYMTYLSTNTATATPQVTDVTFAYTSGCIPPGQILFQGLSQGTYTLDITAPGYTAYSNSSVTVSAGWQENTVSMSP